MQGLYEVTNSTQTNVAEIQLQRFCDEKTGKYGFKLLDGEIVIEAKYDSANNFSEGLASVEQNNRWGFINQKDEVIIDFLYSDAGDFSEGLASVEDPSVRWGVSWGFINKEGKLVIDFLFKYPEPFKDGISIIFTQYGDVAINKQGKVVFGEEEWQHLEVF